MTWQQAASPNGMPIAGAAADEDFGDFSSGDPFDAFDSIASPPPPPHVGTPTMQTMTPVFPLGHPSPSNNYSGYATQPVNNSQPYPPQKVLQQQQTNLGTPVQSIPSSNGYGLQALSGNPNPLHVANPSVLPSNPYAATSTIMPGHSGNLPVTNVYGGPHQYSQSIMQQPLGNNNVQSHSAPVNYPVGNGVNQTPQVGATSMYNNNAYTATNTNGVGGPVDTSSTPTSSTPAHFGGNVSNNAYPPHPSYGIETPSASTIPYNGTNVNSINNNRYVGVQPTTSESHIPNYDINQHLSSGGMQPYMGASNLGINGTGYVGGQNTSATSSGNYGEFPSTGKQHVNGELSAELAPVTSYPNTMSEGESVTLERNGNTVDPVKAPFTSVEATLPIEEQHHHHHDVIGVGNVDDSGDEFDDFQDAASTAASQTDSEKQVDHTVNSDVGDTHGNGGDSGYHSTVSSTNGNESQFHTDKNDAPWNSNISGSDHDLINNAPSSDPFSAFDALAPPAVSPPVTFVDDSIEGVPQHPLVSEGESDDDDEFGEFSTTIVIEKHVVNPDVEPEKLSVVDGEVTAVAEEFGEFDSPHKTVVGDSVEEEEDFGDFESPDQTNCTTMPPNHEVVLHGVVSLMPSNVFNVADIAEEDNDNPDDEGFGEFSSPLQDGKEVDLSIPAADIEENDEFGDFSSSHPEEGNPDLNENTMDSANSDTEGGDGFGNFSANSLAEGAVESNEKEPVSNVSDDVAEIIAEDAGFGEFSSPPQENKKHGNLNEVTSNEYIEAQSMEPETTYDTPLTYTHEVKLEISSDVPSDGFSTKVDGNNVDPFGAFDTLVSSDIEKEKIMPNAISNIVEEIERHELFDVANEDDEFGEFSSPKDDDAKGTTNHEQIEQMERSGANGGFGEFESMPENEDTDACSMHSVEDDKKMVEQLFSTSEKQASEIISSNTLATEGILPGNNKISQGGIENEKMLEDPFAGFQDLSPPQPFLLVSPSPGNRNEGEEENCDGNPELDLGRDSDISMPAVSSSLFEGQSERTMDMTMAHPPTPMESSSLTTDQLNSVTAVTMEAVEHPLVGEAAHAFGEIVNVPAASESSPHEESDQTESSQHSVIEASQIEDDLGDFTDVVGVDDPIVNDESGGLHEQQEDADADDFGDFGGFNNVDVRDNLGSEASKPEEIMASQHDGFGSFEAFGGADFSLPDGNSDLSNKGIASIETPLEQDDDGFGDFGDFEAANPVSDNAVRDVNESASGNDNFVKASKHEEFGKFGSFQRTDETPTTISESLHTSEMPITNDPDGDDFGDFGSFEEPRAVASTIDGENSKVVAESMGDSEVNTSTDNDEDDFGDFGEFNEAEPSQNTFDQSVELTPDASIRKAAEVFRNVFGKYCTNQDTIETTNDYILGSMSVQNLLSTMNLEVRNEEGTKWSQKSLVTLLSESPETNNIPSSSFIVDKEGMYPYSHFTIPVGGILRSSLQSKPTETRNRAPEVLSIDLPNNDSTSLTKPSEEKIEDVHVVRTEENNEFEIAEEDFVMDFGEFSSSHPTIAQSEVSDKADDMSFNAESDIATSTFDTDFGDFTSVPVPVDEFVDTLVTPSGTSHNGNHILKQAEDPDFGIISHQPDDVHSNLATETFDTEFRDFASVPMSEESPNTAPSHDVINSLQQNVPEATKMNGNGVFKQAEEIDFGIITHPSDNVQPNLATETFDTEFGDFASVPVAGESPDIAPTHGDEIPTSLEETRSQQETRMDHYGNDVSQKVEETRFGFSNLSDDIQPRVSTETIVNEFGDLASVPADESPDTAPSHGDEIHISLPVQQSVPNVISHSISPILGKIKDEAIGIAPSSLSGTPFIEDVRPHLAHETFDSEFGDFTSGPVAEGSLHVAPDDGVHTPPGPEETSNETSRELLTVKDDALDVAPTSPSGDLVNDVHHQLSTEGDCIDIPVGEQTVEEMSNYPGHNAQVQGAGNSNIVEPAGVEDRDFSVVFSPLRIEDIQTQLATETDDSDFRNVSGAEEAVELVTKSPINDVHNISQQLGGTEGSSLDTNGILDRLEDGNVGVGFHQEALNHECEGFASVHVAEEPMEPAVDHHRNTEDESPVSREILSDSAILSDVAHPDTASEVKEKVKTTTSSPSEGKIDDFVDSLSLELSGDNIATVNNHLESGSSKPELIQIDAHFRDNEPPCASQSALTPADTAEDVPSSSVTLFPDESTKPPFVETPSASQSQLTPVITTDVSDDEGLASDDRAAISFDDNDFSDFSSPENIKAGNEHNRSDATEAGQIHDGITSTDPIPVAPTPTPVEEMPTDTLDISRFSCES